MSWDYYGGYTYTSVADLKAKAKKIIEKAEKSGTKMNPVEIEGFLSHYILIYTN